MENQERTPLWPQGYESIEPMDHSLELPAAECRTWRLAMEGTRLMVFGDTLHAMIQFLGPWHIKDRLTRHLLLVESKRASELLAERAETGDIESRAWRRADRRARSVLRWIRRELDRTLNEWKAKPWWDGHPLRAEFLAGPPRSIDHVLSWYRNLDEDILLSRLWAGEMTGEQLVRDETVFEGIVWVQAARALAHEMLLALE